MHYVLIAGGRNYEDRETITEKLDSLIKGTKQCISSAMKRSLSCRVYLENGEEWKP